MSVQSIGATAGKVWQILGEKGRLSVAALQKQAGEDSSQVLLAVGWLAREGKVEIQRKGRTVSVDLTPAEAGIYRDQNGIALAG